MIAQRRGFGRWYPGPVVPVGGVIDLKRSLQLRVEVQVGEVGKEVLGHYPVIVLRVAPQDGQRFPPALGLPSEIIHSGSLAVHPLHHGDGGVVRLLQSVEREILEGFGKRREVGIVDPRIPGRVTGITAIGGILEGNGAQDVGRQHGGNARADEPWNRSVRASSAELP